MQVTASDVAVALDLDSGYLARLFTDAAANELRKLADDLGDGLTDHAGETLALVQTLLWLVEGFNADWDLGHPESAQQTATDDQTTAVLGGEPQMRSGQSVPPLRDTKRSEES